MRSSTRMYQVVLLVLCMVSLLGCEATLPGVDPLPGASASEQGIGVIMTKANGIGQTAGAIQAESTQDGVKSKAGLIRNDAGTIATTAEDLKKQLASAQTAYSALSGKLQEFTARLNVVEKEYKTTQAELAKAKKDLDKANKKLGSFATWAYRTGILAAIALIIGGGLLTFLAKSWPGGGIAGTGIMLFVIMIFLQRYELWILLLLSSVIIIGLVAFVWYFKNSEAYSRIVTRTLGGVVNAIQTMGEKDAETLKAVVAQQLQARGVYTQGKQIIGDLKTA